MKMNNEQNIENNDNVSLTSRSQTNNDFSIPAQQYMSLVTTYNPYRINLANDVFVKGIPYVFITTPPLNLTKTNIEADTFLSYMCHSSRENQSVIASMTYSPLTDDLYSGLGNIPNQRFLPLLTNSVLSIDAKDTVARTKEYAETFYGYKQVFPGSIVDSIVGDEISIKYQEWANIPVIKTHKIWLDYMEKARRGQILPSKLCLKDKFIDYASSIYYFLTDFDGETIIYWAKYTGVAPLNVPYSGLAGEINSHEIPDVTINYSYCYKEDMNPAIFRDFNKVTNADFGGGNSGLSWLLGRTSDDAIDSDDGVIKSRDINSYGIQSNKDGGVLNGNYGASAGVNQYSVFEDSTNKNMQQGDFKPVIVAEFKNTTTSDVKTEAQYKNSDIGKVFKLKFR